MMSLIFTVCQFYSYQSIITLCCLLPLCECFHIACTVMPMFFLFDLFFICAVNNICIFLTLSHAEWKACLIRNSLSSPTVTRVACALEESGIQCVERTGSPTCPHAWLDAPPPLAPAGTQSVTHQCLHNAHHINKKD